jgi:hypothetical protein
MNNDETLPSQLRYAAEAEPRTIEVKPLVRQVPTRSLRQEIFYRVRYFVNSYPALYMPWARYHHRYSMDRIVRPDTDLVIEAFGRTGTTFANFAFLSAQRRRVRTVHHTHAAAQVITAVKMNIPTLVIVREPEAVALSHMARHQVSARPPLIAWIRFHQRLISYRKGIVFCGFEQMTSNFTPVIGRLNEKFGTCFDTWQHNPENEAEIFEQIKSRNRGRFREGQEEQRMRAFALPTAERQALKNQLRVQLDVPALTALRQQAQKLYRTLAA